MRNTCKNCKYWGDGFVPKGSIAKCGHIGIDDSIEFDRHGQKEGAYIDVSVSDDTGLDVALMTRETFSCSDHQPKPINATP